VVIIGGCGGEVGNEEAGRRTLKDDETYMPIADISVKAVR